MSDVSDPNPPGYLRDLLGYLNFSDGTPGSSFHVALNAAFREETAPDSTDEFADQLNSALRTLSAGDESVFQQTTQAEAAIRAALQVVLPAYRAHHADLLFHLTDADFLQPFFLARVFEATLDAFSQGGWANEERLVKTALATLNHFVGYRPVAVLENDRRAEVYDHERFCPVPLYLAGAGVAVGPALRLLESTLIFLQQLPDDLTEPAYFSLDRLSELCLDHRPHDHLHPVNKRTNYMFGEWDPEFIDTKGYYRRFVVRSIILNSLLDWLNNTDHGDYEERLFDASAVMAGTILMASSISGSGPQTYDSEVSLTSLLPTVARHRDTFYETLLQSATGERRRRLERQTLASRQPFGHVRHELNMSLSRYGANQVQHRHLSWLYASMGFEDASREEAGIIPCVSARFESEICSRLMLIQRDVRHQRLEIAARNLRMCRILLQRGIHCGAFVDPWNILGFQGMFPLFTAREDSIPDNRIEVIMDLMEQIFDACSLTMAEAAATGSPEIHDSVRQDFVTLAEQWDRYATTTVADLPEVRGGESVQAAEHVAAALAEWRTAGESAADISFWRTHVEQFRSARSFSQVVTALLDRGDLVAATALLIQWLSEVDNVGLESGRHSIHAHFQRLVQMIAQLDSAAEQSQQLRRLFAFLEANAGVFWQVPRLREPESDGRPDSADSDETDGAPDLDHLFDDDLSDDDGDLFEAAWENVVFRDSADDGHESDMMDEGASPGTTEFEILYRQIEPRLKFLHTLGALWNSAAIVLARQPANERNSDEMRMHLDEWASTIHRILSQLSELLQEISGYQIEAWSADMESNVEFDVQMQARFLLMQNAISTTVEFLTAERLLAALQSPVTVPRDVETSFADQLVRVLQNVLSDDVSGVRFAFPKFLRRLRRRPLLYVPFENGGDPAAILKARTLQAVIRLLLSQLPRLGLFTQAYRLLQTAWQMERTSRPPGQAVTEFDRLFRIGLKSSTEAVLNAAKRWKTETPAQRRNAWKRIQKLLDAYRSLWTTHSISMRLSIVEELHDEDRAAEVREFIEQYGDDLFHTRMLTLGNARAILVHGGDSLLDELEQNVHPFQPVQVITDIEDGLLDRDDAVDLMEFVYESVVDNFDVFLEYNTTTTQSDYGNRLYCLLDFLRLKSLYDRLEWEFLPCGFVHDALTRGGWSDMASELETELAEESRDRADALVEELADLESQYGVRLPTLHDQIGDRVVGALHVNRMTALVARCCVDLPDVTEESAVANFTELRSEIHKHMSERLGSGIDTPEWMTTLAAEQSQIQEKVAGIESTVLESAEYRRVTQKDLDRQLAELLTDEF